MYMQYCSPCIPDHLPAYDFKNTNKASGYAHANVQSITVVSVTAQIQCRVYGR